MGLILDYEDGQTPLDEEEKNGLIISTITTHGELNEFEQQNIEKAIQWLLGRTFQPEKVFTENFVRNLHNRMYKSVWAWAGQFRHSNKNIGIDWPGIPVALKQLLDDAMFWYNNQIFTADEIAVRFKHRLVSIHCFSNGNGRHSRLMADIIIEKIYKQPAFSWGSATLAAESNTRADYLKAVKAADEGNFSLLIAFARS